VPTLGTAAPTRLTSAAACAASAGSTSAPGWQNRSLHKPLGPVSLQLASITILAFSHRLELLEVLLISLPTPRGQEAQLDQVVEAHRIAREGRIDNASGKEEDDQDQFSSYVSTYLGWVRYVTLQPAEPKHFFSRILIPISESDLRVVNLAAIGSTVGTSFGSSFGAISSSWS